MKSSEGGQSLDPRKRLRERWQFLEFMGRSKVTRLAECAIYSIPNREGHFRLGITLKARGSSVERNRVKRTIRELFRTHAQILEGHDYNVVVPATKKMSHPYSIRLREELRKVFFHETA